MARRRLYFQIVSFSLFLAASIGFYYLDAWQRDDFALRRLKEAALEESKWTIPPLTATESVFIQQLLDQPFTYLGKGTQAFVFESADHAYVLKFMRKDRYSFPSWPLAFDLPPFEKELLKEKVASRISKGHNCLESCHLAYLELKEEAGLVFLHLNHQNDFNKKIQLIDAMGSTYEINLDSYAYLIQKKASPLKEHFQALLDQGQEAAAKQALDDLLTLLRARYKKGIYDGDATIHRNAGFTEQSAIYIDVGQFSRQESIQNPLVYREETRNITKKLRAWLSQNNPRLSLYLEDQINQL